MGGDEAIARFLSRAGTETQEVAADKLRAMRRLILITLACEGWVALRYVQYSSSPELYGAIAAGLGVCALLGWRDRFAMPSIAAAFLLELVTVASVFPDNGNHQFLALILLALLALSGSAGRAHLEGEGEGEADASVPALQAMRWIVLGGLAWSGVMKLVSGYWFGGEFLSYRIAIDPGFARIFDPIIPDAEMARLVALENRVGEGPFRAQAPLLVAVSNLTWLAEIVLPIGLLWSRTRTLSMVAALALMVAIQMGAREVFFAGLMMGGLLLFARRDRVTPFLPIAGVVYILWLLRPELTAWLGLGGTG